MYSYSGVQQKYLGHIIRFTSQCFAIGVITVEEGIIIALTTKLDHACLYVNNINVEYDLIILHPSSPPTPQPNMPQQKHTEEIAGEGSESLRTLSEIVHLL